MVVAHGLWSPGTGLLLWNQADDGAAVDDPGLLPAPPGAWSGALRDALAPAALRRRVELALPTRDGHPLAPGDHRDAVLAPHLLAAAALAPPDAVDLLLDVEAEADHTRDGWALGPDLRFLGEVVAGLARWVWSGRVVPTLREVDDEWWAGWTLVDDGATRSWRRRALQAWPPVLRAELRDGRPVPAATVLDDLVTELTDALVSATLALSPPRAHPGTHPLTRALDDGEPLDPTARGLPGLAAALARWRESGADEGPEVLFRLLEPAEEDLVDLDLDGDLDGDLGGDLDAGPAAAPEPRWLLETCLRSEDAAPVPLRTLPSSPEHARLALTALGEAMTAWPRLRGLSPNTRDHVVVLSTADAVDLVEHGAVALREAGFTVLLPRAWTRADPALRLAADTPDVPAVTPGRLGMDQLVDYTWSLTLGGETVTPHAMRELVAAKAPLVRLRGEWVRVDAGVLSRAARYVAAHGTDATTGPTATSGPGRSMGALLATMTGADPPPVPVEEVTATGWLGRLLGVGDRRVEPVGTPAGLEATLRPYQQRGVDWLAFMSDLGLGVVLADDMGLGKTVQLLALLCHELPRAPGPTLLVCPMSVVGNWQREAARFAPHLRVLVHHGAARLRGEALTAAVAEHDLVITTYALVSRDRETLAATPWRRVALDEAQHVKNATTAQARAVRALPAEHRLALTGTPVENRLEELRSLLDFANPGMLGSAQGFRARFAVPIERDRDEAAVSRLRAVTTPFVLRRVKTDPAIVPDLPARFEMVVRANLTPEQASLYQAVVDEMLRTIAESAGMQRKALVLQTLTRLKQVCNHPAHFLADGSGVLRRGAHRSGKLSLVEDVVESVLGDDERALLFTQFRQYGDLVGPWLAERFGVEVPFLHGGVGRAARDAMVADFQTGAGAPLMLLSLKAGGTGLNLTAANHVVHLDRWWNPAVEDQATDRAFRIGQRRDVQVRKLVCVGTVEERIDALVTGKSELADLAVGDGEGWLTELGTDELRDLLTLGPEAVGG